MTHPELLQQFREFDLPVDGIASMREGVLWVNGRTIDLTCGNIGYIRSSGLKRYGQSINITCDMKLISVTEEMYLILILYKHKEGYINKARSILMSIDEVSILSEKSIKDEIEKEENIPSAEVFLHKFTFNYTYKEIPNCQTNPIC